MQASSLSALAKSALCWVFFTGLLLFAGRTHAQGLENMPLEMLDTEDGLSNNWMMTMVRDSFGFVWISTRDGLNRYDGYQFKVFHHDDHDSTSLLDDFGQHLIVDPKGRLWVGYPSGGMSMFDHSCQCFINYRPAPEKGGLPKNGAEIVHFSKDGKVWYLQKGLGLSDFDPVTGKSAHYDLPFINPAYSADLQFEYNTVGPIYESFDGFFWVTSTNGLYKFDPRTHKFEHKPLGPDGPGTHRSDCFTSIRPEGDKGLWLTAWEGGVSYFDFATETFKNYKYSSIANRSAIGNNVYALAPRDEHTFWTATIDYGLGIFDKTKGTFHFDKSWNKSFEGLESQGIAKLLQVPGNVMFMLSTNGIIKYNPNAQIFHFRVLPIAQSQNTGSFFISRILEDTANHNVYFATQMGNGLNVLDTRTGKLEAYPVAVNPAHNEPFMIVVDLAFDTQKRLWVLSRDYIFRFDAAQRKLIRANTDALKEYNDPLTTLSKFRVDPFGNIWVYTNKGGLHKVLTHENRLGPKINRSSVPGAPQNIHLPTFDENGNAWMLENGNLIQYKSAENRFEKPYSGLNKFLSQSVRNLVSDRKGNLWAAVYNLGLLKIDVSNPADIRYKLFSDTNGLPTRRIYTMSLDPQGNLWLATIGGVVYFNTTYNTYRVFNQPVGMEKNTSIMAFHPNPDGTFYISAPGKYCKVDLQAVNRKAPLPKVYLDKFSVFNQEKPGALTNGTTIVLRPDENVFSFEFGCIDFTNQALHRFAYMLEGWDDDWVQAGSRRYASYTNLNGGNYVFKVKVANGEGVWSEPVSVPVFIETPIHQRTWFMALAAVVFASLIYALYLYRVRQIEQTEQLKTEFNRQLAESRLEALRAQMNPHFIFNCLNSINRYIIESDTKTASLYLTRFAKLIRLILDNSKHKTLSLSSDLEALRLYIEMEALRFEHKFTFEITVDDNVDADSIEVPPLIIQPYVENAIWHGLLHKDSDGHLSVHLSRNDGVLTCTITDNGVGRSKAEAFKSKTAPTRQSVGMKLTEERIQMASENDSYAGTSEIIDLFDDQGAPCGTRVIITLPV